MKYQILCQGFIGDILFASSIAKKLHEQDSQAVVDYVVPLSQPFQLLRANPYIHDVMFYSAWTDTDGKYQYDKVIQIPLVNQAEPATIQFQRAAGIQNPSLEFDVYTLPHWDNWAKRFIAELKKSAPQKDDFKKNFAVGYDIAWQKRAYNTREWQNLKGVGGPHRDIDHIVNEMREHFLMIPIGLDGNISQHHALADSDALYAMTASLIKKCDWMVGAEGGLTNLAAGVHTKTVITSDFIHQLYGVHGLFKPCPTGPKMGPATYYPNDGHRTLDPWITDEEVADQMIAIIKGA